MGIVLFFLRFNFTRRGRDRIGLDWIGLDRICEKRRTLTFLFDVEMCGWLVG